MITIGIDPHKSTVTAVAVQDNGTQLGTIRLPVTTKLQEQLLLFASEWTDRQWAVEGATGSRARRGPEPRRRRRNRARCSGEAGGQGATAGDRARPQDRRARRLFRCRGRARNTGARTVAAEDDTVPLRLLSDHRDDLVSERTRVLNRLHRLLRELVPGGATGNCPADPGRRHPAAVRPVTAADTYRKQLARDLLDSLRTTRRPGRER